MFDQYFKSDFAKNVLTLMSGTVIGQAIPFLATFILARIFTPDEFGVFAVYFSLVNIIGTISTGRYEMAILLPKSTTNAFDLVKLSLLSSLIISLILYLVINLFYDYLVEFSTSEELMKYIYLLPISVFGFGAYKTLGVWFTRKKQYKKISLSIIVKSIVGVIFNIGIGYYYGIIGLFLGNVFGALVAVLVLNPINKENYKFDRNNLLKLIKRYKKFPLFDIPASFIYTISKNGIVLIINKGYSPFITGFYSLTERIMIAPSQVFVGSYTQVYNQKVTEDFNLGKEISTFVSSNVKRVAKVLVLPFIIGSYLSYYYVPIIFGENWMDLYKYIYVLAPLLFFTMILNPLSYIFKIKDKQDISFIQHLILTVAKLGSLYVCVFILEYPILLSLVIYAVLSIAVLSFNAHIVYKILNMKFRDSSLTYLMSIICIIITIVNYILVR